MKMRTKKLYCILTAFLSLVLMLLFFGESFEASASTSLVSAYESQNVLDDLSGGSIGGKTFSLSDYPFDSNSRPQVLHFAEYGYSAYSDEMDDYGLYVYVYNPQGLAFDTGSSRNKIQFTYGDTGTYIKVGLKFLNYSTASGYEGLFYKFKVILTESQRSAILSVVNSSSRVYEVSEIEISIDSEVTDYEVLTTYTYSGYAYGYGSNLQTESSLTCTTDGFDKYISLDVEQTFYRPEGSNGNSDYTQDTLHSVYFAVDDDIISDYGDMTAVHATWLEAVLKPFLVTGNITAYNAIKSYLGLEISADTDLDYAYVGDYAEVDGGGIHFYSGDFFYNFYDYKTQCIPAMATDEVNPLYLMFYSGSSSDSADGYTVTWEEIYNQMLQWSGTVTDRFAEGLFSEVADEYTDGTISCDPQSEYYVDYDIMNFDLTSTWTRFWGGDYYEDAGSFTDISAIEAFDYSDLSLSATEISEKYFIDDADVTSFISYCTAAKLSGETVYLFRYAQSEYFSQEATLLEKSSFLGVKGWDEVDTNAYFAYETVFLDFDIIDLTFSKSGVDTIIPVLMNPIDTGSDATSPIVTEEDGNWWDEILAWFEENGKKIVAIIALVLVLVILAPFLPYIVKGIVWIVMLPFKAIGALWKAIKKAFKKRE